MDFNKISAELGKRPWLVAAVIVTVLILSRGKSGGGSGYNYDAMLQSQQIATSGNLQNGQIYAQMYATDAARNAAYVSAQKDVILGQQSLTALDKTLRTQMQIKSMESNQIAADSNNGYVMGLVSNLMSHRERIGDLQIQASQINNAYDLGVRSLNNDAAGINADLMTSLGGLANDAKALDIQSRAIDVNADLTKFQMPFTERMHQDDNATARDLAWRMKQIAKVQASANLFGGLINSITGLIGKGADIYAAKT